MNAPNNRPSDDELDFTLDDIVELSPDPVSDASQIESVENTRRLLAILHAGSTNAFIQNIKGSKRLTQWFKVGEPLIVPQDWLQHGNVYFGVHGTTVRITDKDRQKDWAKDKADSYIERYVASKNETIEAVNALYAEVDGKDFTDPSLDEVNAEFAILRANPDKAKSTDKALMNEALGAAKLKKYLTDPEHYKALALAHVDAMTPAPSVVVASGGGYQLYWLLAETFYLRTDADRQIARQMQERWVAFVGGDPGAKDLRRVLRLPGTRNNKKAYAPEFPLVAFVKANFSLRYRLTELNACLPTLEPTEATRAHRSHQPATEAGPLSVAQLTAKNDSLVSVFNATFKIRDFLLQYGYTDHGDRMSRPGEPESKGVEFNATTNPNQSRHWSSSDQLYDEHWQTPFSIWCKLEFGNDFLAARQSLIDGIFPKLRLWGRTTSFEPYIPDEYKTLRTNRKTGTTQLIYVADGPDTKVFDSVVGVMERVGSFKITMSKRIGGRSAGMGANTWLRSLERMCHFFEVTVTDDRIYCIRLKWENVVLSEWTTYSLLKIVGDRIGGPSTQNDKSSPIVNEYSTRKAHDPFLIGTSRTIKQQMAKAAIAMGISDREALEQLTFASFGEGGIRVLDAIMREGDMTAHELAEETGKKLSSIRTACARLVQHGLLGATREGSRGPKVYSLADDVWARLEAIAPHLRTFKLSAHREDRRLVAAVQYAQKELETAQDPTQKHRLTGKIEWLSKKRIPILARLHDDMPAAEVKRLAYDVTTPFGPHPATQAKLERLHATARIDAAEARRAEEWQLIKQVQQLRADGDGKKEAVRKLTLANYTANEAWNAVNQVWRVAGAV